MLMTVDFSTYPSMNKIEYENYDIIELFGYLGGLAEVFTIVFSLLLQSYSSCRFSLAQHDQIVIQAETRNGDLN